MRNGMKVYDSDIHVTASAEDLEPYLASSIKKMLPDLEKYKDSIRRTSAGATLEPPYSHRYNLGGFGGGWGQDAPPHLGRGCSSGRCTATLPEVYGGQASHRRRRMGGASRLRDMDEEGVDVQLMVPEVPRGHHDPC